MRGSDVLQVPNAFTPTGDLDIGDSLNGSALFQDFC